MAENQNLIYKNEYKDAVLEAYQKADIPLMKVVQKVPQDSDRKLFDIINEITSGNKKLERSATTSMKIATDPFYTTEYTPITHERRANYLENITWATLISEYDTMRMVSDPTSIYVQAAKNYMASQLNALIFKSLAAPVRNVTLDKDGVPREESLPLPIANTIKKDSFKAAFEEAKTIFDSNNVSEGDRFLICDARTRNELIKDDKIASGLYANSLAVSSNNGNVSSLLGINVILHNGATIYEGRQVKQFGLLVQKESIKLAIAKDIKIRIDELPHKNYAKQIFIDFAAGGTRVNDKGVLILAKG